MNTKRLTLADIDIFLNQLQSCNIVPPSNLALILLEKDFRNIVIDEFKNQKQVEYKTNNNFKITLINSYE